MNTPTLPSTHHWSVENIIDLIRRLRNDLIKDFLDERVLKSYLKSQFNVHELSPAALDHIRSHLKELLISPVDVKHYEPLIHTIKDTNVASLTEGNEGLFYQEIDAVLKNFIF